MFIFFLKYIKDKFEDICKKQKFIRSYKVKFLKIKKDLKKILDFLEIKNMIIKIEKLMNEFDIRFR